MNAWVFFLILLGLFAIFSGIPVLYRALFLGIGVLVGVRWGSMAAGKKVQVNRDLTQGSGFSGTDLVMEVQLKNLSRLPVYWLLLRHSFSEQLGATYQENVVTLPRKGVREVKMMFRGQRRGIYEAPETQITVGDPLGLGERSFTHNLRERIVIYPPLLTLEGFQLRRRLPWGEHRIMFGLHEDPSRLRGCRDYTPGDPLKRIHWPNVARTGNLQVKEWETTLKTEIGIFLDLNEDSYPVSEWLPLSELGIELAGTLSYHLTGKHERLGFYCNGRAFENEQSAVFSLPPQQHAAQARKIFSYLAGVNLFPGTDYELLLSKTRDLIVGACLLLITPQISPALAQKAGQLRRAGYYPVFLWIKSARRELPMVELSQAGIESYAVERRRTGDAVFTPLLS
ncbi:MAG TPA: DUF58 domain-containing protein [Bacillota bacterium]|nr:DUF58 domain-containing protein [Bacillota bacterium]